MAGPTSHPRGRERSHRRRRRLIAELAVAVGLYVAPPLVPDDWHPPRRLIWR